MSSIKERALIEPLVDNVDPEQICTSSCQMKTIDILDMRVEDANFEVCSQRHQNGKSCSRSYMLCVRKQSYCVLQTVGTSHMAMLNRTYGVQVPFKVTASRNDYIHALVAYFDISFTQCHKPVKFSTSPRYGTWYIIAAAAALHGLWLDVMLHWSYQHY